VHGALQLQLYLVIADCALGSSHNYRILVSRLGEHLKNKAQQKHNSKEANSLPRKYVFKDWCTRKETRVVTGA